MRTKFSYLYTLVVPDGGDYKKYLGTKSTETDITNNTMRFHNITQHKFN